MTKQNAIKVEPLALPFDAALAMPGSKSHAARALVAASLANGETIIECATPCDDVRYLVHGLQMLGFDVQWLDEASGTVRIRGGIPQKGSTGELFCGNAGTAVRFLTALACLVPGDWVITGDARMQKRPIHALVQALTELGADIADTEGCPAVRIRGGTIRGGSCSLDASKSSQYLTALLLIGAKLKDGLSIALTSSLASPPYLELTKRVLGDFGCTVTGNAQMYGVQVQGDQAGSPYVIEGDWSAAGAFLVLAEITGSRFHAVNLNAASAQGDRRMPEVIEHLRGDGNRTLDVSDIPDQLMNLCVLAAHRNGSTTFTGARNLRIKETDRLAVITGELRKAGIDISEDTDGVTVGGKAALKPAELDPHDDHRMAMAFAILGSAHSGITIVNPDCVSKSYPAFFTDLERLRSLPRCIALVGMRGSGKTRVGMQLADRLGLSFVDTDAIFTERYGAVRAFVESNGWERFRVEEERLVPNLLRPGTVVALGGGAVESAMTRSRLTANATVVWVQADEQTLIKRLQSQHRPPLTDMPLEQEVPEILKKRTPLYREVASIVLPPDDRPIDASVSLLVSELHKRCSW